MLDLTTGGDLQARLYDETLRTYQLTTGGGGSAAFHQFSLQNAPGSSAVSFLFDGRVVESQWDGISLPHANTAQWGNSNQAGAGRGMMDFQSVSLQIGPFVNQPIDYDGDQDVDGNDLLVWQRRVGTTVPASSGVPEPTALALAALAAAALAARQAPGRSPPRRG
jgi:hypothetical protein